MQISEKMPEPEEENYFLVNMVEQWCAEQDDWCQADVEQ